MRLREALEGIAIAILCGVLWLLITIMLSPLPTTIPHR